MISRSPRSLKKSNAEQIDTLGAKNSNSKLTQIPKDGTLCDLALTYFLLELELFLVST